MGVAGEIGNLVGRICITPIVCMILGLPIALYLHSKRGYKWGRAIGSGGLIVFCLVVLIGAILSLTGEINLSQLTSIVSSNLQPTYTAYPTYNPQSAKTPTKVPPLVATLASGFAAVSTEFVDWDKKYKLISCDNEPPEGYTSKRCFDLSIVPPSRITLPASGAVYYSGDDIAAIGIIYKKGAHQLIVERCAQFVIDVGTSVEWNLDDLGGIMASIVNAEERKWITFNTITANHWLESGWWEFQFQQAP